MSIAVDQENSLIPIRKLESFLHPRVDSMPTIFTGETTNFNTATRTGNFSKVIPRMNQVGGFMTISRRYRESFLRQ